MTEDATRAAWSTAYVNNLPDSAFLYVAPGGSKDGEGKTVPRSLRYFPVKDANGNVDMPHLRNAMSRIPQSNLPASVKASCTAKAQKMMQAQTSMNSAPPRENLFRAEQGGLELRDEEGTGPVLTGHFAVFDQWTEINSAREGGPFLERISPGAFKKTIAEGKDRMRVLFNHGQDVLGNQALGVIRSLEETDHGAAYEVPLFDSVPPLIVEGLRAGQYGSSFRFNVLRENYDRKPKKSDYNPRGLPERTVLEARVPEFGPVTFPAYAGATAGLRSITDEVMDGHLPPAAEPPTPTFRMDAEDLGMLAQMIVCGTEYLNEQDETDDQANIAKMEAILASLAQLVAAEAQETEPDEPGEEAADPSIDESTARTEPDPEDTTEPEPKPDDRATTPAAPEPVGTTRANRKPGLYRKEPQWLL